MRSKLLFKFLLIMLLIIVALWQLYPSYNLNHLKEREDNLISELSDLTELTPTEIRNALINQELESVVRSRSGELTKDSLDILLSMSSDISKLYDKIDKTEPKAIKRGLDLQGGTYLVYEVDFQEFVQNLAKFKDTQLEQLIPEIDAEAKSNDLDFFDMLSQKFEEKEIPLSTYFGKKGDNNQRIIADLRDESEEAIGRSLEVLRNRIDQFGVSEPSIQKQGSRRIVVELAGIQDVNRAKRIIGKTALLEFKLVRDWEDTWAVIQKIDKIVKNRKLGITDSTELSRILAEETVAADSVEAKTKIRDDKEIDLEELFGETDDETEDRVSSGDTALSVDKELFEENPFLALFGNVNNLMAAPKQNITTINRILNYPEVKEVIPNDSEFLWSSQSETSVADKSTEYFYLLMLKKEAELTGNLLEDADVQVSSGSEGSVGAGQSEVHLTFNNEGAKIFSRVTGANVGKNLAIVLDDKIRSHPRIKEKIPYGNARIDGMANIEEAKDLVVVLRAGSLPAKLEVIEERTVGPSLGRDSIQKGTWSAVVGFILVVIFMIIYYRLSGIIANFALILNIIFLLAVLAAFHFTLTMPGVAGIILTIGMAVDANVLIFERIREELKTGKTIRASIDSGYGRAFTTILDANVTTLLTALVLYQFGTGPIKGFAVTLMIGLVVNMFTAIYVTRFVYDFITSRWQIKKLSI